MGVDRYVKLRPRQRKERSSPLTQVTKTISSASLGSAISDQVAAIAQGAGPGLTAHTAVSARLVVLTLAAGPSARP